MDLLVILQLSLISCPFFPFLRKSRLGKRKLFFLVCKHTHSKLLCFASNSSFSFCLLIRFLIVSVFNDFHVCLFPTQYLTHKNYSSFFFSIYPVPSLILWIPVPCFWGFLTFLPFDILFSVTLKVHFC